MAEGRHNPLLELRDIRKTYRTRRSLFGSGGREVVALNSVSLEIYHGEIFGLVGESGSGKTTVGRLIVRLEDPEQGSIRLEGVEVTKLRGKALRDFRRKVQMIFQDPYQSLNPQLSVFDTVSEPLTVHRIGNSSQREEQVRKALTAAGLSPPEDYVFRYPHQLSGGQRQRVAIARAMVLKPSFIVADEPTSMLDASISAQIFNILIEMREKLDATLLFITHSLAAARYLCDRIAVIYKGNLMEIGSADEIIQNPIHPYTRALLDALPRFGDCGEMKYYGTLLGREREYVEPSACPFFPRCRPADETKCSRDKPLLKEIFPSHFVACFEPDLKQAEGSGGDTCFYGT